MARILQPDLRTRWRELIVFAMLALPCMLDSMDPTVLELAVQAEAPAGDAGVEVALSPPPAEP